MLRKSKAKAKETKKVEVKVLEAEKDTKPRSAKVVDMDKKLAEVKPATGRTRYQQYLREKINNADIK